MRVAIIGKSQQPSKMRRLSSVLESRPNREEQQSSGMGVGDGCHAVPMICTTSMRVATTDREQGLVEVKADGFTPSSRSIGRREGD